MSDTPDGDIAIEVKNVSKAYGLPITRRWRRSSKDANAPQSEGGDLALRNVSLTIRKGELVGIIGRNGSGKSTLLKMIAGVSPPTEGSVRVVGGIFPMIELMAGMSAPLSGRENVVLLATILGLKAKEIEARMPEIEAFCELGPRFDQPVSTYSSGMPGRLGFAVAMFAKADVLLIDEVLAVGDVGFKERSSERMQEMSRSGKTVLLVTHSLNAISALCSRVILLEDGVVTQDGPADDVVAYYQQKHARPRSAEGKETSADQRRIATGAEGFVFHGIDILDGDGQPVEVLRASRPFALAINCSLPLGRREHTVAIAVSEPGGKVIVREARHVWARPRIREHRILLRFPQGLPLRSGQYSVAIEVNRVGIKGPAMAITSSLRMSSPASGAFVTVPTDVMILPVRDREAVAPVAPPTQIDETEEEPATS